MNLECFACGENCPNETDQEKMCRDYYRIEYLHCNYCMGDCPSIEVEHRCDEAREIYYENLDLLSDYEDSRTYYPGDC